MIRRVQHTAIAPLGSGSQPPGRTRSGTAATGALAGAVVFAVCLAVVYATRGDGYWIADCGNKALVAERLLDTRYRDSSFDYPAGRFDPERRWFPIPPPFALSRGDRFVSIFAPAYAALAAPPLALLGPRGLRVPAALGAAASAALFVVWVAPALGRRLALAGALCLVLASPVFFYGVTVWEHSLTVALVLASAVLISRDRAAHWAGAGALVGAACWLREDLALMAAAVGLAAVLTRRPARLAFAFAAAFGVLVAGLLLLNHHVYGNALGGHVALRPGVVSVSEALGGARSVSRLTPVPGLLGGFGHGRVESWAFGLLGVLLPTAGWLGGRWRVPRPWLVLALAIPGAAVWLVGFLRMISPRPLQELVLHNGLLLQWPLWGLVGLGLHRAWRDPVYAAMRTGALAGLFFVALMLAAGALVPSNLGAHVGAGVHWGPRVLLPALPASMLLAIAAMRSGDRRRSPAQAAACAALVVAGILSTGLATWFLAHQTLEASRLTRRIRALEPDVLLTVHPLLAQHLAPLWHEKPTLLTADWASVGAAATALRRAGVRHFLLVVPSATRVPDGLSELACRRVVQQRGRLHYLDLDVQLCRLAEAGEEQRGEERGGRPPS